MERPLTQHIKPNEKPLNIREYIKAGGYASVRKVLKDMTPADVVDLVKSSELKGRGGAGFNTGLKWSFVPKDNRTTKYLLCNADEMEPATFKDRLLLEGNPHQLIEGMIVSSYAIGASYSYIFIRWAYHDAANIIRQVLKEAYEEGMLGKNIMGTDFSLDMGLHTSVGRYICGEETALINSMEGRRANPRAKPPFPQTSGLFGKPTIVNNVETLSCIPHIINNGAEWFRKLSLSEDGGTKLYGVSGRVKKPGLWELPLGITLRELIEEHAGGMIDGYKFRGALPGGASSDFLVEEHLDVKLDFTSVAKAGSRLGTGTAVVLDDKTCPVGFIHNLTRFFANESCGWCTPCREGLPRVQKILNSIENGKSRMEDMDILDFHTKFLGPGNTYCALAPGAAEPLQSGLKYFREDFIKHINERKCTYNSEQNNKNK
jgi:NADH-quinone oxidoreductase subunit F